MHAQQTQDVHPGINQGGENRNLEIAADVIRKLYLSTGNITLMTSQGSWHSDLHF